MSELRPAAGRIHDDISATNVPDTDVPKAGRIVIPLRPQCQVCGTQDNLFSCDVCLAVSYCGADHQALDRSQHEDPCSRVATCRYSMIREETKLRDLFAHAFPSDGSLPHNIGRFCTYSETGKYAQTRNALTTGFSSFRTHAAVRSQLEHSIDTMRLGLDHTNHMREAIPALYLRLGRDQECYDFVKGFELSFEGDCWEEATGMQYGLEGEDVFEAVERCFPPQALTLLTHVVILFLLKIRLLMILMSVGNVSIIAEKLPQELLDAVREQMASPVIINSPRLHRDIVMDRNLEVNIAEVRSQIMALYHNVEDEYKIFWLHLLSGGEKTRAYGTGYADRWMGRNAKDALRNNLMAWEETPGALELLWELSRASA